MGTDQFIKKLRCKNVEIIGIVQHFGYVMVEYKNYHGEVKKEDFTTKKFNQSHLTFMGFNYKIYSFYSLDKPHEDKKIFTLLTPCNASQKQAL